jgi:uncharacterized protein YgiB involved in biofilm formation
MKRSAAIALVSMGAAAVVFYAVRDPGRTAQAQVFRTVQDCILSPGIGADRCRAEYDTAVREHERTGPRYTDRAACEAEFGPGNCEERAAAAGWRPWTPNAPQDGSTSSAQAPRGSVFMPLLAAYMLAQPGAARPFATQPLYPTRPGTCPPDPRTGVAPAVCSPGASAWSGNSYRTGHGSTIWVNWGGGGGTTVARSGTTTVPRTVASPPPSRPNTVARGGFGQTSRSITFSTRSSGG